MTQLKTQTTRWDTRFMGLAEHAAQWSKDPNTKVGSVIVDDRKRIVSLGFNGFPQGVEDTNIRLSDRSIKNEIVVHAEVNAILFSERDLRDCTLYVWPFPPCSRCAAQIIQAGIKRVVAAKPAWLKQTSWASSCNLGRSMMEEAGITIDYIEYDTKRVRQEEFNFATPSEPRAKAVCDKYEQADEFSVQCRQMSGN